MHKSRLFEMDQPFACRLNRKAVAPSSLGLALSATLGREFIDPQPQGGCAQFLVVEEMTQPLCG